MIVLRGWGLMLGGAVDVTARLACLSGFDGLSVVVAPATAVGVGFVEVIGPTGEVDRLAIDVRVEEAEHLAYFLDYVAASGAGDGRLSLQLGCGIGLSAADVDGDVVQLSLVLPTLAARIPPEGGWPKPLVGLLSRVVC